MKAVTIVVLALFTAPLALGQVPKATDANGKGESASASTDAEKALARIEQEITDAAVQGDAAVFERYLADTFTLTTPDGTLSGKAPIVASLKSGDLKFASSKIEDLRIQVYGEAAVATYGLTDKGSYKGEEFGGRSRWTDVFIRREGHWLQVASQGTPLSPKE